MTERSPMEIVRRLHANVSGRGAQPMVFAHGYGCDQNMWRMIAPAFAADYKVVLYDLVGCGKSDLRAYERSRYGSLEGHADDVVQLCAALELHQTVFVGHSVSAIIGVLAAIQRPELFAGLILVGPSPCYIDDAEYRGGFNRQDIESLLHFLDENHLGWSRTMAPVIMGNPDRPELSEELANSFCRTDPEISRHFARVTFLSDNRDDLRKVRIPTLILQCSNDAIAPVAVGEFVHRQIPGSRLEVLNASGHCPHLSAPEETIAAMKSFLAT